MIQEKLLGSSISLKRCFHNSCVKLAKKKPGNKKSEIKIQKYFGRPSSKLSVGIVGLANVGKSTFFQSITKSNLGVAANYPFATIKPEESIINLPSPRLNNLQKLYKSSKKIHPTLTIVDIAGLTKNASKGKGLGNQFLNDIRQVDGIFQVVRGFQNDDIIHIEETVDPVRDLEIVNEELILKDYEIIERLIEDLKKKIKYNKNPIELKNLKQDLSALEKSLEFLIDNKRLSAIKTWTNEDIDSLNKFNLLTTKPILYLLNVNEEDYYSQTNEFLSKIKKWILENSPNDNLILFSASLEKKIQNEEIPENKSSIPNIITKMKENLHLISFFTCGPIEAHEWLLREDSFAPKAGGAIHTDLEKTFINVDVVKYEQIKDLNIELSPSKLKSLGKFEKHGKNYVIEDGDIVLINSSAAKSKK